MSATRKRIVIGTAGHIDHGKTALVRALTGTDTDRLPEEKQRGITIDLGFAAMCLPDETGGILDISIIDVPGHHAFIRNMLAGTGGIDCVMLVIAADEGVKAQTEEHFAVCSLLGIERGLVVLTKCDVVAADHLAETRASVVRFLQSTFLRGCPILPVSALRGEGIAELKIALAQLAREVPARSQSVVPRLPIDRVFSIRGFGTVVTGTLQAGSVTAGTMLEQHPRGRALRVRGVQVHGESCDAVQAPCRVALNLAGVEVSAIARGDMLAPPGSLVAVRTVDVELQLLPGASSLRHRMRVRLHAFASESLATVLLFGQLQVPGGTKALARLRFAQPMLLIPGDRFVVRACSPAMTIGGGCVLDASVKTGLRKSEAFAWLKILKDASPQEQLRMRIERRGMAGIALRDSVAETGLTSKALASLLEPLIAAGQVVACGTAQPAAEHWIGGDAFSAVMRRLLEELRKANTPSVTRAELRSRTELSEPVFNAALGRLNSGHDVELSGDRVRLRDAGDGISSEKRRRMETIERVYAEAGLAAPLSSEVATRLGITPGEMREIVTLLLRSKRLVRMGSETSLVHPNALDRLYNDLRARRGEAFDVGRFKSFTGLTRKHAIPLLEHLDHVRITRNNGGTRVVL